MSRHTLAADYLPPKRQNVLQFVFIGAAPSLIPKRQGPSKVKFTRHVDSIRYRFKAF